MKWEIEYLPQAQKDLANVDRSLQPQIQKGIRKVAQNPKSKNEGGLGTPLGNRSGAHLAGLYKIKFRKIGFRVVYALKHTEGRMVVVVIAAREDGLVYREAEKRRHEHGL
jgi:mRNA interferase RelE/StbE